MIASVTFYKRLLRAAFCAVIIVASWECCARVKEWTQRGVPPLAMRYVAPATYRYDARGLHGIPLVTDGKYRMNSLGYRGPEVTQGKETILCLGASETYGIYESPGHEFPRLLERALAAGRRNVQVVNAALPGARPGGYPADAAYRADQRSKPTVVALYFSPSAVIWTKSEWDSLHRSYESRNPPEEVTPRFRIVSQVRELVLANLPESMKRRRADSAMRQAIARAHATPSSHLPERNFTQFRAALDSILGTLDRHVAVVLITHADRFGSGDPQNEKDYFEARSFRTFYPKLTLAGLIDTERRMNADIAAEAVTHHAILVDAAHAITPGPTNFADFFHFTDHGSALMAALLTDKIKPQLH